MNMSVIKTYNEVVDLSGLWQLNRTRYPYLLQSVVHGSADSHFSILFGFPQQTIECHSPDQVADFFSGLEKEWRKHGAGKIETNLPFSGGWFVFLAYESLKGIEAGVTTHDFPYRYPTAFAARCPAAIIVDHNKNQTSLVAEAGFDELIDQMAADMDSVQAVVSNNTANINLTEDDEKDYLHGVSRILEYIRAGDVFQVNLSRAWRAELGEDIDTACLYKNLCEANPAPFACLIHHRQGDILSSSPERLVQSRDGWVETRPIAGTRPRSGDSRDLQWLEELRTDHKERAEHVMLIDLERNDLGRLCEPGSIEVNEMMTLESYAYVHHIVSNIRGRLRAEISPIDILRAVFPGGTITGCPKVRCMEIIAELEEQGRGPYTGSVGYINHNGAMDFNILIRTLFRQERHLHFRAGAGIVSDSIPQRELNETRHKAKGLLMALQGSADE